MKNTINIIAALAMTLAAGSFGVTAWGQEPQVFEGRSTVVLPEVPGGIRAVIPIGERFAVQAGDDVAALVDPEYSRIEWLHRTQGPIRHFALNREGDIVVCAADLASFDPMSGAVVWYYPLTSQQLLYIDDEIAVLSGFGANHDEVELNVLQLADGTMLWADWARLPAIDRVEVTPDTIYVHPDGRPGWAYPVRRDLGLSPGLKAISIRELPAERKTWDLAKEKGTSYLYQEGKGAVVGPGDVDYVLDHGGVLYVLSHDTVRTFEPRPTAEAMRTCAQEAKGSDHARCLERNVTLTTYMGAAGIGFRTAIDALLAAEQNGSMKRYQVVETLQAIAPSFVHMEGADRGQSVDRLLKYADKLANAGAHLEAYKLYAAAKPYANAPSVAAAAEQQKCLLLRQPPASCASPAR